jgi:hypothetical protein
MSRPIFGLTSAPPDKAPYGIRHAESLRRRVHPMTHQPLRPEGGKCGDCRHLVRRGMVAGTYYKCTLHPRNTGGPATDCRVRWPACVLFEAREEPAQIGRPGRDESP